MPSYAPHPLEAKFIKLALLQHIVTPVQVKRCQETLQQRAARGQTGLSVEQLLQEEGLITEDECEQLWVQIAQAGDTKVRDQLQDKLGTRPVHANAEKTTVRRPEHPEKVPKRLGDYELIEPIGRGGMGAVYKARQIQMERYVALKLLPPELASNAKYIRRFIREARSAGMLNQGNLVHVHDVGAVDGRYFISMELVEGLTVKQLMRREGRVGVLETLRIAEQVCSALECAHRHKIVHRDIKPDNIMLTPQGIAKLCDLGLAKVLEGGPLQDTDTQEGHAMGTPHYMSPEQARSSGKVDARSDLYSLGATIYHMLTGRVPFDGDTPIEVLMRVTNEAAARPDRFEPLLPPPLTALIMRLLAKNPDERPSSAEALRKEFHQLRRDLETGRVFVFDDLPLGLKFGKPMPAPPPRPSFQWRWAAGAGAAAVFLLLAGAARLNRSQTAAPEIEYAAFENPRKPAEHATVLPQQATAAQQATRSVPLQVALDPASRLNLETALQASPQLWPRVLAALETLDPAELAATPADEQAAWAALKARTLKLRDNAAEVELTQRRRGAAALAGAGLYQRAGELLADLPPALRGAAQTRLQADLEDLAERSRLDAERQTRELDALLRAGLTRVALNRCERWSREHDADNFRPGASGMQQARNAQRRMAEEVRQAHRKALESEEAQLRALDVAVAAVARVRQLSSRHDLAGARKEAERLVADSNSEAERLALAFEIERIKRVEALYARVAAAVNERPGRIKESDFRTDAKVSGRVKSLDETHFVVIADPGIQAIVPLAQVTRGEIRTLFAHVLLKDELASDDLLGRLAFDLEERSDTAIRLLLIDLAAKDEGAAALLNRLLAGDTPWLRHQARTLLARAEEKFIEGRYGESQRLTAAALSSIGTAGDGPLEARAQSLLELCAASRAASDVLKPTAGIVLPRERLKAFYAPSDLAGRNSDWTWQGAQPEFGDEAGLAFGVDEARGAPAWKLEAPGGIELDVAVPFEGAGALKLRACPDGGTLAQTWTLALDAGLDGCTAALQQGGEPAAPWAQKPLASGRHHRVWLRLEVGALRWGVNDRELGQQGTGPEPVWKLELRGAGPFKLRGVSAEGRLLAPRTGEDRAREGLAAYTAAMLKTGEDRALELRGLLTDYGANAPLASRICAALADCYRGLDRGADCRYWESRALFECPQERWPVETKALLAGHRLWLHARDRLGPSATDALRFGRVDAYNQPNITMGDPEAARDRKELLPEPEPEPKPPGAQEQAGSEKNRDVVRRVVVRITSGGTLVEEYKEPAVGLERPRQP